MVNGDILDGNLLVVVKMLYESRYESTHWPMVKIYLRSLLTASRNDFFLMMKYWQLRTSVMATKVWADRE